MRRPSRSNGTRARRSMRSVWSRLTERSVTVVEPAASMPGDQHAGLHLCARDRQLVLDPGQLRAPHGEGWEATLARLHARTHALEGLRDAVDRPLADRGVAVEGPDAAGLPRKPSRQQSHERAGVADVQHAARGLERRMQAHPPDHHAALALLLDARAERLRALRVERVSSESR